MALAPISWPPSGYWDGVDGYWSSFPLRIGSPAQILRVLPSTAAAQICVVSPQGCPSPFDNGTWTDALPCNEARGGLFDVAHSSSWHSLGESTLGIGLNLGYDDSAPFGLDTVALGYDTSPNGSIFESAIVAAVTNHRFFLGIFGLGRQRAIVNNLGGPHSTFLSAMKNQSLIPSLSWAYTAGAKYRKKGVLGSLTLGGYDQARFIPNNVSISVASDVFRDLVVGLQSITLITVNDSMVQKRSLLPTPILTFVDSTIPSIILPSEACKRFEETLGLSWDETNRSYWVNDTLHGHLLALDFNLTFTIGDATEGGPTVQIVLSYASFDLELKYPEVKDRKRYFPLGRAFNESQYTLGRTFLQEAYIIADYERSNFSVSQCRFEDGVPSQLTPIRSVTEARTHLRRSSILGMSMGSAALLMIIIAIIFIVRRKRQHARQQAHHGLNHDVTEHQQPPQDQRLSITNSAQEIDNDNNIGFIREIPDTGLAEMLHELPPEMSPSRPDHDTIPTSKVHPQLSHELRAHRSFQVMEPTRVSSHGPLGRMKEVPERRCEDTMTAEGAPSVEKVLGMSAQPIDHVDKDDASVATSTLAQIYSSYMR